MDIKEYLTAHEIAPSRHRGQHFLISEKIRDRMVAAAELTPRETVLEIGPGLGVLTFELAKRARKVIAVEIDPGLARFLGSARNDKKGDGDDKQENIEVINADVLSPRYQILDTRYLIVSNLPYEITSPFFRKFLEGDPKPSRLIIMIQDEVAERIAATPPRVNPLAILVQTSGRLELLDKVSPASFFPQPRVWSRVIRLTNIAWPSHIPQDRFMRFVHAAFASPRKKLVTNIGNRANLSPKAVAKALIALGYDPGVRPGEVVPKDWLDLWTRLKP